MSAHRHAIRLDEWMAQKAAERARRRRNRVLWRWSLAAVLAVVALLVLTRSPAHAQEADQVEVRVTFYVQSGTMASGIRTHKDAAACSQWMPFGTQLRFPDGYVVTCLDRGHGDWYWPAWVDVYAPSYAWGLLNVERDYGLYARVSVLRWGWGE